MTTINPAEPKNLNFFQSQTRGTRYNPQPQQLLHASYFVAQHDESLDPFSPRYGFTQVLYCMDKRVRGRVVKRRVSRKFLRERVTCVRCAAKLGRTT